MNMFLQFLGILIALIIPTLNGFLILNFFKLPGLSQRLKWLIAFLLGHTVFSLSLFIFAVWGFPLNIKSGLLIPVLIFPVLLLIRRLSSWRGVPVSQSDINSGGIHNRFDKLTIKEKLNLTSILLMICAGVLFGLIFTLALSQAASASPGQAVWGCKAMVIYKEAGIPVSLFTDITEPYTQQSYPLGYPLLLAWCHMCMGEFNDHLIKLVPALISVLVFLTLYSIFANESLSRTKSLLLSLLFSGNYIFIACSTTLYADNLLLLYTIQGFYLIYVYLKNRRNADCLYLGLFLLAGGAWIKNEGLLYFLLAVLCILILDFGKPRRREILRTYIPAIFISTAVCILPWLMFRYYLEIALYDFAFSMGLQLSTAEIFGILKQSALRALSNMFVRVGDNCGVWYALIFVLAFYGKKIAQNKALLFPLMITFSAILFFILIFVFSTRPPDWHLRSIQRIFLIPTALAWMSVGFAMKLSESCSHK